MKNQAISTDEMMRTAALFDIDGSPVTIRPAGNGHINDTFLVEYSTHDSLCGGDSPNRPGHATVRYILQRINDNVFHSPDKLMDNIIKVTDYLRDFEAERSSGGIRTGYPLHFMKTYDGGYMCKTETGFWRMMTYIDNTYVCESSCEPVRFREIGRAYGAFINDLAGFPADQLNETISGFHDTRRRFENLLSAIQKDPEGRRNSAAEEISFALGCEKYVDILNECAARGELPLRVTHNDTKINNILLDRDTGKAVCVIDLDTVMPGLAVNDFGDAIRSGAVTGREDEPDASIVKLDIDLYNAFRSGFIEGCPDLTEKEMEMLPAGARNMTLECGIRFLTDYLEGDKYFRTDYPEHNLIRCRTQFRRVRDMEEKWDLMRLL